jgi:hypothetical protein
MAAMEWLKLHKDIRNDAKLRSMTMAQRWIWVALLTYAGEQPERGVIADYDPEILAVEVCDGDVTLCNATVTRYIALRMLHVDGNALVVTNFEKRQAGKKKPSDSPERVKLRVQKHRNAPVTPRNAPVTPRNATDKDIDSIVVVEEEAREAKTETPKDIPPQYQAAMQLRDRLIKAAESLSTKGVLTKAHRGKLDGWLAQYKKRLTVDMIDYAVEETAGHTGGDALDYFLKVIVNRIENPAGNKPPRSMNGKNGYAPPTGANLQSEVPPHGYSWDGGPGKWRKMERGADGLWPFGCATFTQAQRKNEEAEAQFYAAREEAPV